MIATAPTEIVAHTAEYRLTFDAAEDTHTRAFRVELTDDLAAIALETPGVIGVDTRIDADTLTLAVRFYAAGNRATRKADALLDVLSAEAPVSLGWVGRGASMTR